MFQSKRPAGQGFSSRSRFPGSSRGGSGGSSFPRSGSSSSRGGSGGGGFRPRSSGRFGLTREQKNFHPAMFIKKAELIEEAPFVPVNKFADFNIDESIKKNITIKGYVNPTPIQDGIINHILEGHDVIGLAQTGTGKTAAFLIPLIHKMLTGQNQKTLIIAPTRELAVQIEDECRSFARNLNITTVLVIGGANMKRQVDMLRRRHSVVIGTPGRLIDVEKRGALKLVEYNNIVLDEVDRMLDMGFINDVKYLIAKLPQVRHSLFFSATMSDTVKNIARDFLRDPITVKVMSEQTGSKNVDQDVIRLEGRNKIDVLHDLLIQDDFKKVLLFGKTKHGIRKLGKELRDRGFKADEIHGDKSQFQRQRALDMFKQNRLQVLLATDIASRGLDIDNVSHVINYDVPQSYEDYIHRIGRTGRADKKGFALTFME